MDRSLDEIISERPAPRAPRGAPREPRSEPRERRPPPPRAPRREEYPRDGVRKFRRDEPVNMNEDWVHDRYEEDRRERFDREAYDGRGARDGPYGRNGRAEEYISQPAQEKNQKANRVYHRGATEIRVDNLHYEVSERDLHDLFERIGPVAKARMLYDRADRSTGTAFVTYQYPRDAKDAIKEFDNQSAKGQIIRLTLLPTGPAGPVGPAKGNSLFDRVQPAPRSLFDRIQGGPPDSRDEEPRGGRRRPRSESPRRRTAVPEHIDRYTPGGRGSRSPIGRRGTPRDSGRRPGQRREESGRPPRGPREEGAGRKGKPRKTAEELDAEMADYFGGGGGAGEGDAGAAQSNGGGAGAAVANDDVDMVE